MALFETQTCSRCGGSGRHSFNMIDGDRCYGCGGSGVTLTTRGAAARKYMLQLQTRLACELQVGDYLWLSSGAKAAQVASIEPDELNEGRITIRFTNEKIGSYGYHGSSLLRSVRNEAERQETIRQALEYQANLTKAGKVRK